MTKNQEKRKLQKLQSQYVITDHSILRLMERVKPSLMNKAKDEISRILLYGEEIKPSNNLKRLLNNNCKQAKYLIYRNAIAVIEGDVIKTIINYEDNSDHWEQLRCNCKGGPTGRCLTPDEKHQVCDTCGLIS